MVARRPVPGVARHLNALTGENGRDCMNEKKRKKRKNENRALVPPFYLMTIPGLTIRKLVYHRPQRPEIRMTHCILSRDPLFRFVLHSTRGLIEAQPRFDRARRLRRGICSRGRVRRCLTAAPGGSATGAGSSRIGTTETLRCSLCPATSLPSVFLNTHHQ